MFTVCSVDKAVGAPAFAAPVTLVAIPVARTVSIGSTNEVSILVAVAPATSRLRVSGSVMFAVTTAGIGKGVETGTSPKSVEVSENSCSAGIAASDKMGIAICGKLVAIDTAAVMCVDGLFVTSEKVSSKSVVVPECLSEYLSVEVTTVERELCGTAVCTAEDPVVAFG